VISAFIREREDQKAAIHGRPVWFVRSSVDAKIKKRPSMAAQFRKSQWRK
jgi:hypothetical protein